MHIKFMHKPLIILKVKDFNALTSSIQQTQINKPYHEPSVTTTVFFKMYISSSCLNTIYLYIYLLVLGSTRLNLGVNWIGTQVGYCFKLVPLSVALPLQDAFGRVDFSIIQLEREAKNIFVCLSCLYFFSLLNQGLFCLGYLKSHHQPEKCGLQIKIVTSAISPERDLLLPCQRQYH